MSSVTLICLLHADKSILCRVYVARLAFLYKVCISESRLNLSPSPPISLFSPFPFPLPLPPPFSLSTLLPLFCSLYPCKTDHHSSHDIPLCCEHVLTCCVLLSTQGSCIGHTRKWYLFMNASSRHHHRTCVCV